MWTFLKRVMGTTPEHEAAEVRYARARKQLEQRGKDLDKLLKNIKETTAQHEETKKVYSQSRSELTETLSKTISGSMEAVSDEEIEEFERDMREQMRAEDKKDDEETPPTGIPHPAR